MSPGFSSEFQLGLQTIVAADADHDSSLHLISSVDEVSRFPYDFVNIPKEPSQAFNPIKEDSLDPQSVNSSTAPDGGAACSDSRNLNEPQLKQSSSFSSYDESNYFPDRQFRGEVGGSDANGVADPPHREIISRFYRLKTVTHPHLCTYTNILRSKRRLYIVSEHWSLSLQDIIDAWNKESSAIINNSDPKEAAFLEGAAESEGLPAVSESKIDSSSSSSSPCLRWDIEKLQFLATVAAQTLTALAHLNSLGLSHNRLQPRTIRLDAHGNVRLSEWGLSYLTDGGRLAPSADLYSPFCFLAPEQVLAGPEVLSAAPVCTKHDIWTLGAILMHILQPPWPVWPYPLDLESNNNSSSSNSTKNNNNNSSSNSRSSSSSSCYRCNSDNRSASSAESDVLHSSSCTSCDGLSPSCVSKIKAQQATENKKKRSTSSIQLVEEALRNITQLVLFSTLGLDYQVLLPLSHAAAAEGTEEEKVQFPAAPTASAFGTELSCWLLQRKSSLLSLMQKAIGSPCYMIPPRAYRAAIAAAAGRGVTYKTKASSASEELATPGADPTQQASVATRVPPETAATAATTAATTAAAPSGSLKETELLLQQRCIEGFTQWLSGKYLCHHQHFCWGRLLSLDQKQAAAEVAATGEAAETEAAGTAAAETAAVAATGGGAAEASMGAEEAETEEGAGTTGTGASAESGSCRSKTETKLNYTEEERNRLLEEIEKMQEVLRACLTVHPTSRPTAAELLSLQWLQRTQREQQLWCTRGAESLGWVAQLRVEEELQRVLNEPEREDDGAAASAGALPWLPYSRLSPPRSTLDLLVLHHNIGLEEIFYWWELQGGDVHGALAAAGAFRPVPCLFLLPLCCLRASNQGQQEAYRGAGEGAAPQSLQKRPFLVRVEFLAAFAGCWGREDEGFDDKEERSDQFGDKDETGRAGNASHQPMCGCTCSGVLHAAADTLGGSVGETLQQQQQQRSSCQSETSSATEESGTSGSGLQGYPVGSAAGVAPDTKGTMRGDSAARQTEPRTAATAAAAATKDGDDAFFVTGFAQGKSWREVQLWKEGDLNVVGVSLDETVRALQEADRFPVSQMLEVRPPLVYRRQGHFLYQRLRVRLFKSLLAQLPKSRHRLTEEAARDIPPLLRPEIWAALLGVNYVGVLHTTRFIYDEAAASLGPAALEALQTSGFSQYHEYHDLLGSSEGRRRLMTLVGVTLQRNPLYVSVRGMDALAAPLLLLFYEQENVALACLEKLLQNFQQHLFSADSAAFLKRQLITSNRLLAFLDPQLALHMNRLGLHSDMYALSWHLTLFSHVLPLQQLLLLWDTLLLQPPTFVHFLTVCVLHFLRVPLLGFSPDEESTAFRLLQASFDFVNIPALCAAAVALQNAVPWSITLLRFPLEEMTDSEASSAGTSIPETAKHTQNTQEERHSTPGGGPLKRPVEADVSTTPVSTPAAATVQAGTIHLQTPTANEDSASAAQARRPPEAQLFFIGDTEQSPEQQEGPGVSGKQNRVESAGATLGHSSSTSTRDNSKASRYGETAADTPAGEAGEAEAATARKSPSWGTKALMRVVTGPALILLGPPRKPSASKASPTQSGSKCADPMEALYSSEPLAPRWWDKMSEMSFLAATSPAWSAGDATQGIDTAEKGGEGLALQPPCIGVDELLRFYEESVVLDIRPRASFEYLHLNKAINVTTKDVSELIGLLREGQRTLPDTKGIHHQMQKFGSSSRPLISKMTRAASGAASLEAFQAVTAEAVHSAAPSGFSAAEAQEAAHGRAGAGQVTAPVRFKPWISATMSRLPLVVVVGDKEDCGSGLARRLLTAGVACVCVLLGGIDALQFDAPSDFLTRKYRK